MLGYCESCGYFEGKCKCGRGKVLLTEEKREKVSKFLSGLLRHFPDSFGIKLDDRGFAKMEDVVKVLKERYGVGEREITAIVLFDRKGRFEMRNGKIRAKYGHSVKIDYRWSESGKIPEKLYHGTKPENVDSILKLGLLPMKRNEVHLSESIEDAVEVGRRYCESPAVLEINAKKMIEDGFEIRKKGKVYTADFVPSKYVRVVRWRAK